jgi:hypothetical protein
MKKSVTSPMVVDPAEGTPPKRPHRKRTKKPQRHSLPQKPQALNERGR